MLHHNPPPPPLTLAVRTDVNTPSLRADVENETNSSKLYPTFASSQLMPPLLLLPRSCCWSRLSAVLVQCFPPRLLQATSTAQ
ncbi:hypothetical protein M758_6G174800 [Ceratodon purpureus]|uniref:Uncharacterized protein n=1 Tax=Ceratodon purpureus TaxID=3225 RepID=A0A8T0HG10_CERPU|nr:hypothetical protein KC19_6G181700 [Ceratodon purpureus]KAG0614414.1 hypothetical protein M758_6G174800 [Ceratodon purpureus]